MRPPGQRFFSILIDAPTPHRYQNFGDTTLHRLRASVTSFLPTRNFPQVTRVYINE
jgi:hypothetical protein